MPEEPNWRDNLPAELKDHASLKDIKDVAALGQSYVDAQATMGNSIRVPGPDAGDDATKAFHAKLMDKVPGLIPTPDVDNADQMTALFTKLGRPDTAVGYDHPEGVDATQMGDFANLAHGAGLTKSQYSAIMGGLSEFTTKREDAQTEAHSTAVRELKQEWGIVYEDNIKFIDSVMKGTGAPKEMLELAANGKLPPEASKWLYNIGKQLGTEGINFEKDPHSSRVAPAEAKARAAEMIADRTGPYWTASHPEHKAYVQRYVDLMKAAAAGGG